MAMGREWGSLPMTQSQLWLCYLEGLRSTPKWGQNIRTGRYWEGQGFTGERGGYIKVRRVEEGDVGRQPLWNCPFMEGRIRMPRRALCGWYCLQRHLQAIRGITSPRNPIFLRGF